MEVEGMKGERCEAEIGTFGRWHSCKRKARFEAREKHYKYGSLYYCALHVDHGTDPKFVKEPTNREVIPMQRDRDASTLLRHTSGTRGAVNVIVLPLLDSKVNGWPEVVRLTNAEAKAMERIHLGGMEALRTANYRCASRTIDSLVVKGLLFGEGPTMLGRYIAKFCAEAALGKLLDGKNGKL